MNNNLFILPFTLHVSFKKEGHALYVLVRRLIYVVLAFLSQAVRHFPLDKCL